MWTVPGSVGGPDRPSTLGPSLRPGPRERGARCGRPVDQLAAAAFAGAEEDDDEEDDSLEELEELEEDEVSLDAAGEEAVELERESVR